MTIKVDLAEQHAGFERPPDGLCQKTCPRCGSETLLSYGLMGGGYGPYVICAGYTKPDCDWFYKEQSDRPEAHEPANLDAVDE